MENTYKIPTTAVIHEFLDDEIIAANLDSGVYYSMRDCSIPIWQLLLMGKTPAEIALLFSEKYNLPVAEISPSLQLFLTKLIDEAMLAPINSSNEIETNNTPIYWPEKFNAPVLEGRIQKPSATPTFSHDLLKTSNGVL